MDHWYVIKTKPKKEKSVVSQLSQADFELFFPVMKGISGVKALFPSYLFVQTNFENYANHRLIRYTRGVHSILGDDAGPVSVESQIIETIKSRTRDGLLIERDLLYQKGSKVRVRRGVLKDLEGIVEKHCSGEERVQVLFKWLSGTMRAKLHCAHLERVA
jgi:transcription antitermination factor NusG